jgi:hypothetical protein
VQKAIGVGGFQKRKAMGQLFTGADDTVVPESSHYSF